MTQPATPAAMQPLDIYGVPLQGLQLIEASAGTGKTWTIAALYLRLLLSSEAGVEDILVVTFTKAATAELRSRIRERINQVRLALLHGDTDDDFCRWMLQQWQGEARVAAIRKLELARRSFDQAVIFTIHGFCQRALSELQVPALLNEPEIVPDERKLIPGLVNEAWIRHCVTPLLARLVDAAGLQTATLLDDLQSLLRKPYMLKTEPLAMPVESELQVHWQILRRHWQSDSDAIIRDVLDSDINRGAVFKGLEDTLALLAHAMDRAEPYPYGDFRDLVPAVFEENRNKRKKTPRLPAHAFWATMATFWQLADQLVDGFRRAIIADVRTALGVVKAEEQQISYQDLLILLSRKVEESGVAAALRQRYPAALIDEFQDTDPLQFAIFRQVYAGFDAPAFFVGDPKQAIYSFRGADIFTYIDAREHARAQYTLDTNRRSVPGLVDAVNTLFAQNDNPFLLRQLAYQPVKSVPPEITLALDDGLSPFVTWLLPDNGGKLLSKEAAGELSVAATATEIARLLNAGVAGRALINDAPLAARDIAVLVSTHRQGRMIAAALAERGVAAVLRSQDSVFATADAQSMLRMLEAVADPGNDGLLKAALLSDFVGMSLHGIATVMADDSAWTAMTEPLLGLREQWQQQGFMVMWESLLDHFGVFSRLLAGEGGERRLTNLRHLAVLMQQKADAEPSVIRQLTWLREQFAAAENSEETVLRLESDAERVQIMTIHVSKGLEFPVVFCPFLWDGALLQKHERGRAEYHGANGTVLDLGSAGFAAAYEAMGGERLAEKLRLLYVALTRARFRCYTCWGPVRDMETAALTWLLLGQGQPASPPLLKAALKGTDQPACEAALSRVAAAHEGFSWTSLPEQTVRYQPASSPRWQPQLLHSHRTLYRQWSVSSFTGLTAAAHEVEAPDHDTLPQRLPLDTDVAPEGIHAFPRGAQAGVFWHEVLELTLKGKVPDHRQFIEDTLRKYDLDLSWAALVERQLGVFMDAVLDAGGLRLGQLDGVLAEMEFTYPVQALSPEKLRSLGEHDDVAPEYRRALAGLDFSRVNGYLKGFIDLICRHRGRYYVIDYKTNWLGPQASSYSPEAMRQSMADSHYYLQYWLYTLALHRYLRQALPDYDYERDVGGVRYLYLRGIDGSGQHGVYASRPSRTLIETLDAMMEGHA
jgi:exodeoxyribonuclease V beta subunit